MALSPLNQRRWRNFRANGRAFWSLIIFSILFGITLFAELVANDKPLLVQYRGEFFVPVVQFYPETAFGGDFETEAVYHDVEVECLIVTGGIEDCFDDPEGIIQSVQDNTFSAPDFEKGWAMWSIIRYLSLIHIPSPRDGLLSRMPSSA